MLWICNSCLKLTGQWWSRCPGCHSYLALVVCDSPEQDPEPLPLSTKVDFAVRFDTGVDFFDDLCMGGLPAGTVTVIAGEPGCGKSTLLLQIACGASRSLLASSERPDHEVLRERARLGLRPREGQNVLGTDDICSVERAARKHDVDVLLLDSWQKFWSPSVPGMPGSAPQKSYVCDVMHELADSLQIAVVVISQVRKDGHPAVANKLLHECDAVSAMHKTGKTSTVLEYKKSRYCETSTIALDLTARGLRRPRLLRAV